MIGDIDSPSSEDQKGMSSLSRYLSGETPQQRQKWRDQVLETSSKDLELFGSRLSQALSRATSHVVVVGSKQQLEEFQKTADMPMTIENALDSSF